MNKILLSEELFEGVMLTKITKQGLDVELYLTSYSAYLVQILHDRLFKEVSK